MTNKPKFNIGDEVFFVEASCSYGARVPCTMCFGKRKVTIILGNDERVESECGYCEHGIERSNGYSTTWGPSSVIHSGPITGLSSRDGEWRYEVGLRTVNEHELFTTREEAVPSQEISLKEETERKSAYERDHFVTATKKQIWSVGYHRSRIYDHRRQIEWHEMRLCMIKPAHREPGRDGG